MFQKKIEKEEIETGGGGIDCTEEVLSIMMTAWMMLLIHSVWFPLRIGNTGSFPRPLKAEEEKLYLDRMAEGDMEARNKLIEHNLRLVAHIIKNG